MEAIISTNGLEFESMIKYPDIEIEKGEAVFIVGASGSGKSTLLKLLNNTVTASSGDVFFNGKNILDYDAAGLRRKVLLAGQNPFLFSGSIRDNFDEYYEYSDFRHADINECLKTCCVEFPQESVCDNMSGGERQRIFLAVALSMLPEVLMLDEPTAALDSALAVKVMENITCFCKRHSMTLLVVSHDMKLSTEFADRVIDLEGCKL